MTKKKNKKSLIKRILAFTGAVFCSIVCAFSLFNFSDNESMEVSADEVITDTSFYGSNLLFYSSPYCPTFDIEGESIRYLPLVVLGYYEFDFHFTGNTLSSILIGGSLALETNNNDGTPTFDDYHHVQSITNFSNNISFGNFSHSYNNVYYQNCYINICLSFSSISNGVPTFGVPIGYRLFGDEQTISGYGNYVYYVNHLQYFDVDGNYVDFMFIMPTYALTRPVEEYIFPNFVYEHRTYYFEDGLDLTNNQYYNQGYATGLSNGYNNGFAEGQDSGYDMGYKAGELFGYNNGYSEGSEDSNQYTFLNLVSSVIDAPMTYFTSLFNFELLGVNLQGFLMALFTLCVIVTIVKLCLGG